jgi:hypothetical protein
MMDTMTLGSRHNLKGTVAETLLHYLQIRSLVSVWEVRDKDGFRRKRYAADKKRFLVDVKAVPRSMDALALELEAMSRALEARAVHKLDTGAWRGACRWVTVTIALSELRTAA